MPIQNNLKIITLTAGGLTELLPVLSINSLYVIKGTATLTSSWTIDQSGTAYAGMEYRFKYEADIILNGSTITFFGTALPATLANKKCEINAYYDGVDWEVNFLVDANETGSLPGDILANYNISDKEEIITIPISWETDRLVKQRILLPYSGGYDIHGVWFAVTKTIEATDDAKVYFFDSSLAAMTVTSGAFYTIPAGSTGLSDVGNDDFTSNITQTGGTTIFVETTKVTPGGEGMIYLLIKKD
jgi:hypothetical protein